MKKMRIGLLLTLLLFMTSVGLAQKPKLNAATASLEGGQIPEAKEAIDMALQHEETKNMAKTHYVAGRVYQTIVDTRLKIDENAAEKAFDAYVKALELGEKEADAEYKEYVEKRKAKNKPLKKERSDFNYRYKDEIVQNLKNVAVGLKNDGAGLYGKDNKKAFNLLQKAVKADELNNKKDTLFIYYTGMAAYNAKDYKNAIVYMDKAIELEYGKDMPVQKLDAEGQVVKDDEGNIVYEKDANGNIKRTSDEAINSYIYKANAYKNLDDKDGYAATIKAGAQKYPDEERMVNNLIQLFLDTGDDEKAMKYLKEGVEKDPKNHIFLQVLGTLYEKSANSEKDKVTEEYDAKIDAKNAELDKSKAEFKKASYSKRNVIIKKQNALKAEIEDLKNEKIAKSNEASDEYIKMAIDSYKKAAEAKSDYLEPFFNLGALYYNKGNRLMSDISVMYSLNDPKEKKLFEEGEAQATDHFKSAQHYLEKAHKIDPEDIDVIKSLKKIYYKLKLMDKYKAMDEKLK